ncbi:MAG: hypothetical protein EOP89_14610 [Lysobacteraceae bacterium]|nr:MAG: hypothetical protein EOP89_14610 [Xanthomonadaceae bacterium]
MHNRPLNHVVTIAGTPTPYAFLDETPLVDQETREMVDRMVAERRVGNHRLGEDETIVVMIDTSMSMPRDLVRTLYLEVQDMVGSKFSDVAVRGELRGPNRKGFYRDFEHKRLDGSFRRGKRK